MENQASPPSPDNDDGAYLEHYPEQGGPVERILIAPIPFDIGRGGQANYTIYSRKVSTRHATIYKEGEQFKVRDHNSTNGTFVNGDRITEALLTHGDILHFADKEYSFCCAKEAAGSNEGADRTIPAEDGEKYSLILGNKHLREMLLQQSVLPVYHPIVYLDNDKPFGYEVLLRGTHNMLSPMPGALFHLAEQCQLAAELSRLIRAVAAGQSATLPGSVRIFINLHPEEMTDASLIESIIETQRLLLNQQRLVVEISESAVTNPAQMRSIKEALQEAKIELAYDDFGAGQARFMELVEVPPDFVKYDLALIRNIEKAPPPRLELLRALTKVALDMGIKVIAEGVETRETATICRDMGCQLGQGFLYGRPQPAKTLLALDEPTLR